MSGMIIGRTAVNISDQLNNTKATKNDTGTFSADSAHDGLSTTTSRGSAHDDKIFTQTTFNSKTIDQEKWNLFSGVPPIPPLGNLPEMNNTCYVYDVHKGATLKGVNQFLDSAPTPRITEFISNMIKKFHNGTSTPDFNTVTGVLIGQPGDIYMFQMYNSLINKVSGPNTIAHRLDYSIYSNYDLLLFVRALENIDEIVVNNGFCGDLNTFLKKTDTDANKNKTIKGNIFTIVNTIALNFLWQNLINYCERLFEPKDDNPRDNYSLEILRSICFCGFEIESTNQITFAKYKIGFSATPSTLKFNTLDLTDNTQVGQYLDYISYKIADNYKKRALVKQPSMVTQYTFITSQTMAASAMKKLSASTTLNDRGEEKESKNPIQLSSMESGIAELFITHSPIFYVDPPSTTPLPEGVKLYFYQLLKFQGDSSHLVMAELIQEAYERLCKGALKFHLDDSFNYALSGPNPMDINITILTGEKPLTIRSVLEKKNVQTLNFVPLKIYPGYELITHIADPCQSLNQRFHVWINLIIVDIELPETKVADTVIATIYDGSLDSEPIKKLLIDSHYMIIKNFKDFTGLLKTFPTMVRDKIKDLKLHTKTVKNDAGKEEERSIFPCTLFAYLNLVNKNLVGKPTDVCKELISSNYADVITFNRGFGKKITLNQFSNIISSNKAMIEYFSKIKDFYTNYNKFIRSFAVISGRGKGIDQLHTFDEMASIYEFISQTYTIFDRDGNILNEYLVKEVVEGATLKTKLKEIYQNINTLVVKAYPYLNDFLNTFYLSINPTMYFMKYYSSKFSYTNESKAEPTYIVHSPWTKNTEFSFIYEFESFFDKQQEGAGPKDAGASKKSNASIQKKEYSYNLARLISLFYENLNKDLDTKVKEHYEKYDNILNILKMIHFITEIKNIGEQIKQDPTDGIKISISTVTDYALRLHNYIKEIDIQLLKYSTPPHVLKSIGSQYKESYEETIGNILQTIKTNISETISQADLLILTNPTNRNLYKPKSTNKSPGFLMSDFARDSTGNITDSFGQKVQKFGEININSNSTHKIMMEAIAYCLNKIYEEDVWINLMGKTEKLDYRKRIVKGGTMKKKTNKRRTLKIRGGTSTLTEELKTKFNKIYYDYMKTLNLSYITPHFQVFNTLMMDKSNSLPYEIDTFVSGKIYDETFITRTLTRIYFNVNNKSMNTDSRLFSFHQRNEFVEEMRKLKTSQDIGSIIRKFLEFESSTTTIKPDMIYDSLNSTVKFVDLIDTIKRATVLDRLNLISRLVSKLSFYDNRKTLKLDHLSYKTWIDVYGDRPLDNLTFDNYFSDLSRFYSYIDYNKFIQTNYTKNEYTYEEFEQKYIFNILRGTTVTIQTKDGKILDSSQLNALKDDNATMDLFQSGELKEVETLDTTIPRDRIEAYKVTVKKLMNDGYIRDYTVLDFVLFIIKNYIPDLHLINDTNGETIFDCYYALINSLLNSP